MSSAWQQQRNDLSPQNPRKVATSTHRDKHAYPIASTSATCPQCHLIQSAFYCTICLSERIVLQHADQKRLGEARQRAKNRVDILLGIVDVPSAVKSTTANDTQQLPDPFIEPIKKKDHRRNGKGIQAPIIEAHRGASIQDRIARATISELQSEYDENTKLTFTLQRGNLEKKRKVAMQRRQLDRRKELLRLVKGNRKVDKEMRLVSPSHIEALRKTLLVLQTETTDVAVEMTRKKVILVQTVLSIYDIRAPPISPTGAKTNSIRSQGITLNPSQRSKERYSGGAFAIDFSNAFDLGRSFKDNKAKEEVAKNNDWMILGLALPIPSEIYRIDRGEINGAINHTVQLLQLVTTYLGISLPFIFSMHCGSPQIRANPLWGAGSKETLHLSEATYNSLCASASGNTIATTVGSMGASMMSTLGASTLSTLESFVQLPSAKNLPWASKNDGSKQQQHQQQRKEADRNNNNIGTVSSPQDDPNTINARRFCTALTMLSFDIAYIVYLQGIKIDLIMAAGSILRLISRALHSPDLGKRSHISFIKSNSISTLHFSAVDFAQLSQIHDPGSNASNADKKRTMMTSLSNTAIMEESYVDARKAAESILNLKQKRPAERLQEPPKTPPSQDIASKRASSISQPDKVSSLAAKRVQSSSPHMQKVDQGKGVMIANKNRPLGKGAIPAASNTLDFLRARGQREVKTSNVPIEKVKGQGKVFNLEAPKQPAIAATPIMRGTGTVTFNGKEIRGKAKSTYLSERHRVEEDGWHVL